MLKHWHSTRGGVRQRPPPEPGSTPPKEKQQKKQAVPDDAVPTDQQVPGPQKTRETPAADGQSKKLLPLTRSSATRLPLAKTCSLPVTVATNTNDEPPQGIEQNKKTPIEKPEIPPRKNPPPIPIRPILLNEHRRSKNNFADSLTSTRVSRPAMRADSNRTASSRSRTPTGSRGGDGVTKLSLKASSSLDPYVLHDEHRKADAMSSNTSEIMIGSTETILESKLQPVSMDASQASLPPDTDRASQISLASSCTTTKSHKHKRQRSTATLTEADALYTATTATTYKNTTASADQATTPSHRKSLTENRGRERVRLIGIKSTNISNQLANQEKSAFEAKIAIGKSKSVDYLINSNKIVDTGGRDGQPEKPPKPIRQKQTSRSTSLTRSKLMSQLGSGDIGISKNLEVSPKMGSTQENGENSSQVGKQTGNPQNDSTAGSFSSRKSDFLQVPSRSSGAPRSRKLGRMHTISAGLGQESLGTKPTVRRIGSGVIVGDGTGFQNGSVHGELNFGESGLVNTNVFRKRQVPILSHDRASEASKPPDPGGGTREGKVAVELWSDMVSSGRVRATTFWLNADCTVKDLAEKFCEQFKIPPDKSIDVHRVGLFTGEEKQLEESQTLAGDLASKSPSHVLVARQITREPPDESFRNSSSSLNTEVGVRETDRPRALMLPKLTGDTSSDDAKVSRRSQSHVSLSSSGASEKSSKTSLIAAAAKPAAIRSRSSSFVRSRTSERIRSAFGSSSALQRDLKPMDTNAISRDRTPSTEKMKRSTKISLRRSNSVCVISPVEDDILMGYSSGADNTSGNERNSSSGIDADNVSSTHSEDEKSSGKTGQKPLRLDKRELNVGREPKSSDVWQTVYHKVLEINLALENAMDGSAKEMLSELCGVDADITRIYAEGLKTQRHLEEKLLTSITAQDKVIPTRIREINHSSSTCSDLPSSLESSHHSEEDTSSDTAPISQITQELDIASAQISLMSAQGRMREQILCALLERHQSGISDGMARSAVEGNDDTGQTLGADTCSSVDGAGSRRSGRLKCENDSRRAVSGAAASCSLYELITTGQEGHENHRRSGGTSAQVAGDAARRERGDQADERGCGGGGLGAAPGMEGRLFAVRLLSDEKNGFGISLQQQSSTDGITIDEPGDNTGLSQGDRILEINNISTLSLSISQLPDLLEDCKSATIVVLKRPQPRQLPPGPPLKPDRKDRPQLRNTTAAAQRQRRVTVDVDSTTARQIRPKAESAKMMTPRARNSNPTGSTTLQRAKSSAGTLRSGYVQAV